MTGVSLIILSGPVGAGKTTVARELLALLPPPVAYIEGDTFWRFAPTGNGNRRESFGVILRSMTAAAVPFARTGSTVLLDFSMPPDFLPSARRIIKELPLDFVVLLPSRGACAQRAAARPQGRIANYQAYEEFYALFAAAPPRHVLAGDDADAATLARNIHEGLAAGTFRLNASEGA